MPWHMACAMLFCGLVCAQEGDVALLAPPESFEAELVAPGVPQGWQLYGASAELAAAERVTSARTGEHGLLIRDTSTTQEVGIKLTVEATGGPGYVVSVWVAVPEGGSTTGAYLQMHFLPSDEFVQRPLRAGADGFRENRVVGVAPGGTNRMVVYIYTHRAPTPVFIIDDVAIAGGVDLVDQTPPPPTPPEIEQLKDLHLDTPIVSAGGEAAAVIVVPADGRYDGAAERIRAAVYALSGAELPVLTERSAQPLLPPQTTLICVGNRNTNPTISELYDRYYTLLDLKYPGPGGYVVRTLHNPYGNGRNIALVGGSDDAGVSAAAAALIARLEERRWGPQPTRAPTPPAIAADLVERELTLGWTIDIRLSDTYAVPEDIRDVEIWEASEGYGSSGYFGWNLLTKHIALYYMTGREEHAREFLRLAFPDQAAKDEIAELDGERIENKDAPLSGPYHYNAHLMILYWDLIEESPVFTDADRLRVTRAFAKQLEHRRGEGIYGLDAPPEHVGTRHDQWSAVSLYCLGRYFSTYYPHPVWTQCVRGAESHFRALYDSPWVYGESDNLYWYCTGIAPVFTYLILTGDRVPVQNGVVATLLRGQEALISGVRPSWALRYASLSFLNKVAYITGDGRWVHYREQTPVDTSILRLGQSFEPGPELESTAPRDLIGRWTIHRLPEPEWATRASGLPLDQSFFFASFRSAVDDAGDFILLDGYNGAYRNHYHTFAVLELRIGGSTILKSALPSGEAYLNQVETRSGGMVEPIIAMDAALARAGTVGDLAFAVGEVPRAAYSSWRRTVAQRTGRWALIVDELTFDADSTEMEARVLFQTADGVWDEAEQRIRVGDYAIQHADPLVTRHADGVTTFTWRGPVRAGGRRTMFSLIAPTGGGAVSCNRLSATACTAELPELALIVSGEHEGVVGDLVVLSADTLIALGLTRVDFAGMRLAANAPVDLEWDLATGAAAVSAENDCVLSCDGQTYTIPAGQTELGLPAMEGLRAALMASVEQAKASRHAAPAGPSWPEDVPILSPEWVAAGIGPAQAVEVARVAGDEWLLLAQGHTVRAVTSRGEPAGTYEVVGDIRCLRWWPEHELLLVGCADEHVVAFRPDGSRAWSYTSVMAPEVFEAAKQYWFKSAPGHGGIHGLHTGVYLNDESQAFVGSACTMEILDAEGRLLHRLPVFWGPGNLIRLIDAPNGTRDLLIGRWPNDWHTLAAINSATLDPSPRTFGGVPEGHTGVGGWCAMDRKRLFEIDVDGDGAKEVVGDINGVWNRVTVWSTAGDALYAAHFGPGPKPPVRSITDLGVDDLDGDGLPEIVVALADGLVVCLNGRCEPLWSVRLPSACNALVVVDAGVVVGCADGTVAWLDAGGVVRWRMELPHAVSQVVMLPGGDYAVVGEDGSVAGLRW